MNAPAENRDLEALRQALWDHYEGYSSWEEAGEGCEVSGEYLRQIAAGDKSPPERRVKSLLRWLRSPTRWEPNQPTVNDRRLAAWLRWLSSLLERGLLPGLQLNGNTEGRTVSGKTLGDTLEALDEAGPEEAPDSSDK